jgi:acyl carrier protein
VSQAKALSKDQVLATIDRIMVEEFEVEPDKLHSNAALGDDLAMDSLDGVDLVVALEKAFACRISEEEARSIRTLGDIYDRVLSRIELKGSTT